MIICVSLSFITLGIVIYDKFIRKEPEKTIIKPVSVDYNSMKNAIADIKIDYSELARKMKSDDKHIYLNVCDTCEEIDESNIDEASGTKKELGKDTVEKVINKLKDASKVELLSTSKVCSLYTYYVEDVITIFEADDPNILLVGIEGEGYAYHFNGENVKSFLESFK